MIKFLKKGGGMHKVLIGESSWDLECFKLSIGKIDRYFLHNDFFAFSNKKNTNLFSRFVALMTALFCSIKAVLKSDEIYYSSLNAEVLIISYFFSRYKKSFLFLPNVIGEPSCYGTIFNVILNQYKEKIYVTDSVSNCSLASFSPVLTKCFFDFRLPEKKELNDFTFIVCYPAALSHKRTAGDSDRFYSYTLEIEKRLAHYGLKVYVLFHPRDREYIENESSDRKIINSEEISRLSGKICYVSASSSLSLNRRYGGDYGCWVSIDNQNGLPDSLLNQKEELINLEYFGE